MNTTRRDNKNRVLRTGESQKKDGRYIFKYVDAMGKTRYVYSWRLVETDRLPKGKRPCLPLREKEREIRRDLDDGIYTLGRQMTVCQLYERHNRCKPNVREGTKAGREQLMRLLREDGLGARKICDVRPTDAKGWVLRMAEKGYAYTTVSNHKRSLKAAFYTAVQDDLIRKNPFDFKMSDVLENDTRPKEPLSPAQEESLLAFARTDVMFSRYYDELVILLGTGLRISELCGLTSDDVDLARRVVRVDHQLLKAKRGNGLYIDKPKTKCGVREVYLSEKVAMAFCRVLAREQPREPIVIDGRKGFLFFNKKGKPMYGQSYASAFRSMVGKYRKGDRLPLPDVVTPHTMRHTFCTRMALAGMNPKNLQYVMGHSNIEMTLGYYAHASSETAMEEMRRISA